MSKLVVNCQQITKNYGNKNNLVTALRGVDLQIGEGEMFMLVGPSGCGKTTLISIIAGILNPTAGKCEVLSKEITTMKKRDIIKFRAQNIGFVFQAFNLLPSLTAAENVSVPLLINGIDRKTATEKAIKVLELVGLKDKIKSLPSQLSGGQQQRVAIARSLVHEPKIIVCDEPTSALDNHTGQKVIELMQGLCKQKGNTMIVVTHDNRIYKYADKIASMDDGKIIHVTNDYKEVH